jgi:site-specific DNA recombinase
MCPAQYAEKKGIEHPRAVYLREDKVVPALDEWLGKLFDPANLDETCKQLAAVYDEHEDTTRIEHARRTLADCDDRLNKYRAALEAGTDPAIVTSWLAEVTTERSRAERALQAATPADARSAMDVRELVVELGDTVAVLKTADSKARAALYEALDLRLTWQPDQKKVLVEAQPPRVLAGGVGGGTHPADTRAIRWALDIE